MQPDNTALPEYEICEDGTEILKINDELFQEKDSNTIAKIFTKKFSIDKGTMTQIRYMLSHPAIEEVRIMPDCHRGAKCCIGFTSKLTKKIVPNFIGVDIGCGIISYPLNKTLDELNIKIENLEKTMRELTPMGTMEHTCESIHKIPIVTKEDLDELFNESTMEAYNFASSYQKEYNCNIFDFVPEYSDIWFRRKCVEINLEYEYGLKCLGTLGGGNHFIEVNKNSENKLYVTLHTGSRNLGTKICNFHQAKIDNTKRFDYDEYNDGLKNIHRKTKEPKTIKLMTDDLVSNINSKRHTDYLENT